MRRGVGDTPPPPPPPGYAPTPPPPPPPPPTVVGYGRRSGPPAEAGHQAPASILHARPGAQPLPQLRMQGFSAMPDPYVATQRRAFDRNLAITIAQLLALTQGVLGLINGINALRLSVGLSRTFGGLGVPSLAGGFGTDAIAPIVLSVVVIACALLATRPSNVARYLLVAWELIAFAITATLIVQFPFFFGAPDLVLVTLLATGVGFVHPYIVLAMSAVIIFGFAVYPPTWEAYSR